MTPADFNASLTQPTPPPNLTAPLEALWWDARDHWSHAHSLVDELSTPDAMAVHAYLHRKEGEQWNADYWYHRAGTKHHRPTLESEWSALVDAFLVPGRE